MSKMSIFIRDKKKPVLYMFVGLPASGKSYYTRKLAKKTGVNIHSSDDIRRELYGDERIQGDRNTVFNTLHSRIKEDLRDGKSTIYDACNISYKRRMAFLQELNNISCKKVCIFAATPFEKCLENNAKRERYVPTEVIENMFRHFDTPSYFEGWNEIKICYPKRAYRSFYGTPSAFVERYIDYSQDNPHHDYSLGNHCKSTGYRFTKEYAEENSEVENYTELVPFFCEHENVLRISKNLQRKVKKDLFERRKGSVKHNLYSGKNIDLRAICNGSNKVFMQNKLPNNKPLLAASVLIDQSGSMCGTKIYKATVAAMMLEDFCRNLNIPCSVTGHCTSASTVNIYDYIDFGERNPNAKERLAAISCGGCNRDGYAIRYVANKLAKRSEETKLLFIVSDGLPNHSNYGTHELIADLADMNKRNRNNGIIIVPICIEKSCLKELSFIYGSSLVDATDLQKFPVKLNTILARELKKKLV